METDQIIRIIRAERKRLEDFLKTKPVHSYVGESSYTEDAVECENKQNDEIEKEVKVRIKNLQDELVKLSKQSK
jgi:hypothetical protein